MDSKTNDQIEDFEFDAFQMNYESKISEIIMGTTIGRQVAMFEKMGIRISMDKLVSEYIGENGISIPRDGQIVLDDVSLQGIYLKEAGIASKELGFDILSIRDNTLLMRLVQDKEYRAQVISQLEISKGDLTLEEAARDIRREIDAPTEEKSFKDIVNTALGTIDVAVATKATFRDGFTAITGIPLSRSISDKMEYANKKNGLDVEKENNFFETHGYTQKELRLHKEKEDEEHSRTWVDTINEKETLFAGLWMEDLIRDNGGLSEKDEAEILIYLETYKENNKFYDQIPKKEDGSIDLKKFGEWFKDFQIRDSKLSAIKVIDQTGNWVDRFDSMNSEELEDVLATLGTICQGRDFDKIDADKISDFLKKFENTYGEKILGNNGTFSKEDIYSFIERHKSELKVQMPGLDMDKSAEELLTDFSTKFLVTERSLAMLENFGNLSNEAPTKKMTKEDAYARVDKYSQESALELNKKYSFIKEQVEGKGLKPIEVLCLLNDVLIEEQKTESAKRFALTHEATNSNIKQTKDIDLILDRLDYVSGKYLDSDILKAYILENKELFKDYLDKDGKLDKEAIAVSIGDHIEMSDPMEMVKITNVKKEMNSIDGAKYNLKREKHQKNIMQILEAEKAGNEGAVKELITSVPAEFLPLNILEKYMSEDVIKKQLDSNKDNLPVQATPKSLLNGAKNNISKGLTLLPAIIKNREIRHHYAAVAFNKLLSGIHDIGNMTLNKNLPPEKQIHIFKHVKPRELNALSNEAASIIKDTYLRKEYTDAYRKIQKDPNAIVYISDGQYVTKNNLKDVKVVKGKINEDIDKNHKKISDKHKDYKENKKDLKSIKKEHFKKIKSKQYSEEELQKDLMEILELEQMINDEDKAFKSVATSSFEKIVKIMKMDVRDVFRLPRKKEEPKEYKAQQESASTVVEPPKEVCQRVEGVRLTASNSNDKKGQVSKSEVEVGMEY